MNQETKNTLILTVTAIIVIFMVVYFIGAFSDPCTRPYPNAQTIIDCQKLQK